ncbi:HU family DNA-binding protein [Pseudomonas aeruginosa]
MSLTKNDLIAQLAERTELTQAQVKSVYDNLIEITAEALARDNEVSLHGFASFVRSERSARTGRNPQTGAAIKIEASVGVKAKPLGAIKKVFDKK